MIEKEKVNQFYSSKGVTPEEFFEEQVPHLEKEPEKMDYWWKLKVQTWKNGITKEYQD